MHKPRPAKSNADALEVTISALAAAGRLETIDAANIQACRAMAAELDLRPGRATLWREYQTAIERLRAEDSSSDDIAQLLKDLSSPVRNQT